MDIRVLQAVANIEVKDMLASGGNDEMQALESRKTQKKIMDKVRKSLWTLTCQSDLVEMTGVIDDFGGDKDVENSIARAIFGLLCFGAMHNVDIPQRLEKLAGDISAKHKVPASPCVSERIPADQQNQDITLPEKSVADVSASEVQESSEPAATDTDGDTAGADSGNDKHADGESSASESKEDRVKHYEQALMSAKNSLALDRILKLEVTKDENLDGKSKAHLYQIYKDCRKQLSEK